MKNLIIEYEQSRQLVQSLDKKRRDLYFDCEKYDSEEGEICIGSAYNAFQKEQNARSYGDYHRTFSEFFEEGVAGGNYCKNCAEAYRIKHQDLAPAKQRLGAAKRKLSSLGKRLMK